MEKLSTTTMTTSVLRPKESNTFLVIQTPPTHVHPLKRGTEPHGESRDSVTKKDGQSLGLVQTWRKGLVTMARRNARERNRVRQVNQGFLTLCHHIPEPYRMKKMSKVDTLRSAVDYIRNLEILLQSPPFEQERDGMDGLEGGSGLFIHQNETSRESTKEN